MVSDYERGVTSPHVFPYVGPGGGIFLEEKWGGLKKRGYEKKGGNFSLFGCWKVYAGFFPHIPQRYNSPASLLGVFCLGGETP